MWFEISRGAAMVAMPLGLTLSLGILGLLLLAFGQRRAGALVTAGALLWLYIWSIPFVSNPLVASIERRYAAVPVRDSPEASAIAVLGGGAAPKVPPRVDPGLGPEAERLLHGVELFEAKKAPLLILSGGIVPSFDTGEPEAATMAHFAEELGVPKPAIVLETASRNTHENCVGIAKIARERKLGRMLLVTSALHMPRALATCRSAGIQAIPSPSDFMIVDVPIPLGYQWLPDATVLRRSTLAQKEILGTLIYRLLGWISPKA